jgi:hypothetical protein
MTRRNEDREIRHAHEGGEPGAITALKYLKNQRGTNASGHLDSRANISCSRVHFAARNRMRTFFTKTYGIVARLNNPSEIRTNWR